MIWALWVSISISLFLVGIRLLKKMQFNQKIYELGPKEHQRKSGTPTLGGVIIFVNFIIGIWALYTFELMFVFNTAIIWVFCLSSKAT